MKKINVLLLVTFTALAGVAGCEDEPEPAGVAGGGGGGAGSSGGGGAGTGGAGRMMSSDDSPVTSMGTGKVMTNAMGQTMAPITVSTPPVTGGSSVEVSLPMGVTLTGANGQPLSGEATVTLTTNNIEPEGIASFNMMNMTPDLPSGDVVAAQASVTVTVGGMAVASASQPVTINFTIPDGARDAAGNPYTNSSVVNFYSYHDAKWNKFATGPLGQGATEMKRTPNGGPMMSRVEIPLPRLQAVVSRVAAPPSPSSVHGEGN